jgi:hypothetical protein
MAKVFSIGILVLFLQTGSLRAASDEGVYCALTVRVVSPDGHDDVALVTVEEQNGRVLEKEHRQGGVQFCDLGILPVTVKVSGHHECNLVVVQNVLLIWGKPLVLKIISNNEPCLRDPVPPPVPLCEILLRVSDEDDKWIKHARVDIRGERPYTLMTDNFGRAHLNSRRDIPRIGTVSAEGFAPALFLVSCSFDHPQVEHLMTLKRKVAK